jgi:tight adherence protein C
MPDVYTVLAAFLIVTAITFAAGALALRWWPALGRERLVAAVAGGEAGSILRFDDAAGSAGRRLVERLGRLLRPRDAAKLGRSRQALVYAGFNDPRAVVVFFGAKAVCGLACFAAYGVYAMLIRRAVPNVLVISVVLGIVGLYLPDYWLRRRVRAREKAIVNALPNVLDLLVVCVEAGMAFDAAVARVAQLTDGRESPLHQELLRAHLEMRAGRRREDALRALGERTSAQSLKSLLGAFVQAERLGTPLGHTLRVHSESARAQRRHRAEERAHLAPLKMIFPTVLFLMPAFFLVALAPSLLTLLKMLGQFSR